MTREEKLAEEKADYLWEQQQEQLREDYENFKSEYQGDDDDESDNLDL